MLRYYAGTIVYKYTITPTRSRLSIPRAIGVTFLINVLSE